jgi:hypothetical protein
MLRLSETQLDNGLAAALHHGFSSFFPAPPEIDIVRREWATLRSELSGIDLDTYRPHTQIRSFAPKSRINVRRVGLLHPHDFVLYTSLVLQLRESIAAARLGPDRVFSYRTEGAPANRLYAEARFWTAFRERLTARISQSSNAFVGIADIADFFPRIYHHRLENALSAASGPNQTDYIRVLNKLLFHFSDGVSYGIPVGPPASYLLGEAVLIDVDNTLLSYGIDFVRMWMTSLFLPIPPKSQSTRCESWERR